MRIIVSAIISAVIAQYSPPFIGVGLAIGWLVFLVIETRH